jgi:hypothetical protein
VLKLLTLLHTLSLLLLAGTSLLSAIFRGSIKSCVKAKSVKTAPSITVQPFTMLHLDILDSVRSVEDALDHMTHTEPIHGELL